jgi:hypothetical protein
MGQLQWWLAAVVSRRPGYFVTWDVSRLRSLSFLRRVAETFVASRRHLHYTTVERWVVAHVADQVLTSGLLCSMSEVPSVPRVSTSPSSKSQSLEPSWYADTQRVRTLTTGCDILNSRLAVTKGHQARACQRSCTRVSAGLFDGGIPEGTDRSPTLPNVDYLQRFVRVPRFSKRLLPCRDPEREVAQKGVSRAESGLISC